MNSRVVKEGTHGTWGQEVVLEQVDVEVQETPPVLAKGAPILQIKTQAKFFVRVFGLILAENYLLRAEIGGVREGDESDFCAGVYIPEFQQVGHVD